MSVRILISTGIGGRFGMGHAVRMEALAHALVAQGAEVLFVTTTPALQQFVTPFVCVMEDACLPKYHGDLYIEDTPYVRPDMWYQSLRRSMPVVRVDTKNPTEGTCDLLLAPVAHWGSEDVARLRLHFGRRFLYGWDYILLPLAVTSYKAVPYASRTDGPVVLCAGGTDPDQLLARMAGLIHAPPTCAPWLALMPTYGDWSMLPSWMTRMAFDRRFLHHAALVIAVFGVTCYETLYWCTPTAMVAPTNAIGMDASTLALVSDGSAVSLGTLEATPAEKMRVDIEMLCISPEVRTGMHHSGSGLLDGLGAERTATALLGWN